MGYQVIFSISSGSVNTVAVYIPVRKYGLLGDDSDAMSAAHVSVQAGSLVVQPSNRPKNNDIKLICLCTMWWGFSLTLIFLPSALYNIYVIVLCGRRGGNLLAFTE